MSIDVLQVLDNRAAHAASVNLDLMALDLRNAKEAIAELIAAGECVVEADRNSELTDEIVGRLASALAACEEREKPYVE